MERDLAMEQARLEREIAALEASIARAQQRLVILRRGRVKPRGLLIGLTVGLAATIFFFGAVTMWIMSSIPKIG